MAMCWPFTILRRNKHGSAAASVRRKKEENRDLTPPPARKSRAMVRPGRMPMNARLPVAVILTLPLMLASAPALAASLAMKVNEKPYAGAPIPVKGGHPTLVSLVVDGGKVSKLIRLPLPHGLAVAGFGSQA